MRLQVHPQFGPGPEMPAQANGSFGRDGALSTQYCGDLFAADTPILIDEIVTPDSSRFWPADQWVPGREQESFDKQIVRNYLETAVAAGEWDKTPPGPTLPDEVVARSAARYEEAYRLLTGASSL